jgi:hypothetical protein
LSAFLVFISSTPEACKSAVAVSINIRPNAHEWWSEKILREQHQGNKIGRALRPAFLKENVLSRPAKSMIWNLQMCTETPKPHLPIQSFNPGLAAPCFCNHKS